MPAAQDYLLLNNSLIVGSLLFALGAVGFVSRRNLFAMALAAAVMLQGVVLIAVAFGRFHGDRTGEVFGLFALAVAALQVGCLAALVLLLVRKEGSLDVSLWRYLRPREHDQEFDEHSSDIEPNSAQPIVSRQGPHGMTDGKPRIVSHTNASDVDDG